MKNKEIAENNKKSSANLKWFIILHFLILLLSFGGVFAKLASKETFLSAKFIIFYILELGILGVYALAWQQVLKHISLLVAFCNKSIGTIWSIFWGVVLFNESITVTMVIGAIIVLFGVFLVVSSNE